MASAEPDGGRSCPPQPTWPLWAAHPVPVDRPGLGSGSALRASNRAVPTTSSTRIVTRRRSDTRRRRARIATKCSKCSKSCATSASLSPPSISLPSYQTRNSGIYSAILRSLPSRLTPLFKPGKRARTSAWASFRGRPLAPCPLPRSRDCWQPRVQGRAWFSVRRRCRPHHRLRCLDQGHRKAHRATTCPEISAACKADCLSRNQFDIELEPEHRAPQQPNHME